MATKTPHFIAQFPQPTQSNDPSIRMPHRPKGHLNSDEVEKGNEIPSRLSSNRKLAARLRRAILKRKYSHRAGKEKAKVTSINQSSSSSRLIKRYKEKSTRPCAIQGFFTFYNLAPSPNSHTCPHSLSTSSPFTPISALIQLTQQIYSPIPLSQHFTLTPSTAQVSVRFSIQGLCSSSGTTSILEKCWKRRTRV